MPRARRNAPRSRTLSKRRIGIGRLLRACSASVIARCFIRSRNTGWFHRPVRRDSTTIRQFVKQNSSLEAITTMTLNTKLSRSLQNVLQSAAVMLVVSIGMWAQSEGGLGQAAPGANADKHDGATQTQT